MIVFGVPTLPVNQIRPATSSRHGRRGAKVISRCSGLEYSYASPRFGTTPHLAGGRLFKAQTILMSRTLLSRPEPAVTATLGGHTQILLITVGAVTDYEARVLTGACRGEPQAMAGISRCTDHDRGGLKDVVDLVHQELFAPYDKPISLPMAEIDPCLDISMSPRGSPLESSLVQQFRQLSVG
jgi:hypothetical protein